MDRRLVLTSEGAGHPFRRRFPPPSPAPAGRTRRDDDRDVRLFLLSFAAFFISLSALFA